MIKKQIAIGLVALLLIIAGTALIPVERPQADEDVHRGIEVTGPYSAQEISEVTCDIVLPKYPEKVMVYRTVDTNASKDDALKMAEKFGMSGPLEEGVLSYSIKGDPYTFKVEKEGGCLSYTWYGRWNNVDPRDRPENLPTDEEARKIAETFLTSHDLMPEGAIYKSVRHSQGHFLDAEKNTSIVSSEDMQVSFTGTLNNLPVFGNWMYVTVGGEGDIIRIFKRWREAEPYREFEILSPEDAIEELKQIGIVTAVSSPQKATINEIKIGYYASPPRDEQPYLKPAYFFGGTAEGEKGTGTFFQYIPAVPELGKGLY
ncbi:hypothetical protein RJ40_00495 [Methanofollis aquaemaris]|uniref:Uncharacterized protein n=1 Tax=Methanofollis aquaemaris TaxID=126734 RepID=A0A8A3S369_9EURY|nr:hypothetical protein [Methanofollis aquaemaris]QSZ66086.1 hypothetical protein RJ40_00495 [Methanofollis aquaemaris]